MRTKKIVTFLITAVIASSFVACGNGDKKAEGEKKGEIKEFSLFIGDSNQKPVDISATPVGKKITEITGVKFKTEYLVGSDEKTKASLMVASGEYPDLIDPHNEFATYKDAGALIPLDDYIDKYGDNIKKIYGKNLEKLKDPKDGKIYSLTPFMKNSTPLYPNAGFYLPKEVLKEAGYPKNVTMDKYFEIVENYVKNHPTVDGKSTIGFTAETDDWRICTLENSPTYLAGNPNTGGVYIDENNVAHSFQLTDWANKYFKKLNEFWNKGLVDKELFTQNYDAYKAKIASGRVIGFFDERWEIQDALSSMEQQKMYDKMPFAIPVLFDGVTKDSYNGFNIMGTGAGVSITKNCKDPVAAFKLLDKMASDEVQKLNYWGIEGEDYSVKDGKMYRTPEQLAKEEDQNYIQKQGIGSVWVFPKLPAGKDSKYADGNLVSPADSDEYISSKYKDYEKEVLQGFNVKNLSELAAPAVDSKYGYGWDITVPDSEQDIKVAEQKSGELQRKYIAKLITSDSAKYDSIWEEYKTEMNKVKYNIGDDFRTKEIQRRVKEWNK